jgi:hypothetical protein
LHTSYCLAGWLAGWLQLDDVNDDGDGDDGDDGDDDDDNDDEYEEEEEEENDILISQLQLHLRAILKVSVS